MPQGVDCIGGADEELAEVEDVHTIGEQPDEGGGFRVSGLGFRVYRVLGFRVPRLCGP